MPNRTAKELAQEKYNQSYDQFAELLKRLESSNHRNGKRDQINHNEFAPFYEAFKTLSGVKTEEAAQKSLDTLNGFYNYLISDHEGTQKSNFQILYEEAFHTNKINEFRDGLNRMNEELGLRINMNHPAFNIDKLELHKDINAIDDSDDQIIIDEAKEGLKEGGKEDGKKADDLESSFDDYEENIDNIIVNENINAYDEKGNNEKDNNGKEKTEKEKIDDWFAKENEKRKNQINYITGKAFHDDSKRLDDSSSEYSDESDNDKSFLDDKKGRLVKDPLAEQDSENNIEFGNDGYARYLDVTEEANPPLPNRTKNAYDWIEQFKGDNLERGKDQRLIAARIFAARILVNSVPGDGSSLKHPVNGKEIDRVANEIYFNPMFEQFVDKMGRADLGDYIDKYGHGGKLEKKFTEFLRDVPAGTLQNDRVLDRFMPTVWDRIEALKSQAKKTARDESIGVEISEAMILRRMVGAGRNQPDKLKVKIPTVGKLTEMVSDVVDFGGGEKVGMLDSVRRDFRDGHGGLMIANMANMANKSENSAEKKLLNEVGSQSTAEVKFKDLQDTAGGVLLKLSKVMDEDSFEYKRLIRDAKELVAQGMAIANGSKEKTINGRSELIAPTELKIQRDMEAITKSVAFNNELFSGNDLEKCQETLRNFCEDPAKFAKEANQKVQAANDEMNKEVLNTAMIKNGPKPSGNIFNM